MVARNKATIKDISEMTGLSLGTISKYLNGGTLKESNALKIEKAIKELDYNVDLYARAMKTKKTNSIGLIIPELGNTFYGLIASKIGKNLHLAGYEMIVKESSFNSKTERESVKWFIERRTDAIIIITSGGNETFYENLNYTNLVFVDNAIPSLDAESIVVNNRSIVEKSISYLIGMGHKKIAGIFALDSYTSEERELGFRDAFKKANLEVDESLIYHINDTIDDAYKIVEKTIESKNYTALFASNYLSTLGAIFFINKKNSSIFNEVSFLGFDNIMLTNLFRPQLTIINQPVEAIAKKTVERVLAFTKMDHIEPMMNVLECELIIGETVKKIYEEK